VDLANFESPCGPWSAVSWSPALAVELFEVCWRLQLRMRPPGPDPFIQWPSAIRRLPSHQNVKLRNDEREVGGTGRGSGARCCCVRSLRALAPELEACSAILCKQTLQGNGGTPAFASFTPAASVELWPLQSNWPAGVVQKACSIFHRSAGIGIRTG